MTLFSYYFDVILFDKHNLFLIYDRSQSLDIESTDMTPKAKQNKVRFSYSASNEGGFG